MNQTGNEDDIYDYYDTKQFTFKRIGDDDDEDEENPEYDYEHLDDKPEPPLPVRLPQRTPTPPESSEEEMKTVPEGRVKIITNEELENAPRTNNPAGRS